MNLMTELAIVTLGALTLALGRAGLVMLVSRRCRKRNSR